MEYTKLEIEVYDLICKRLMSMPTNSDYHGQDEYEVSAAAYAIIDILRERYEPKQ